MMAANENSPSAPTQVEILIGNAFAQLWEKINRDFDALERRNAALFEGKAAGSQSSSRK